MILWKDLPRGHHRYVGALIKRSSGDTQYRLDGPTPLGSRTVTPSNTQLTSVLATYSGPLAVNSDQS
jgi:hypothetical protein